MQIAITGATSMIGIALIKAALLDNCRVLAIVRADSAHLDRLPQSDMISIIYSDLNKLSELDIEGNSCDVFYHFAWEYTSKEKRDCPREQEKNIASTLDAVDLACRMGCKTFIGAGSQAEYGKVSGVINENTPANPVTAYGMAKLSAGLLSGKMCKKLNMKHIWARIFSVYGANDKEDTMIKYAIECFKNNKTAHFSSGMQKWNYLYEEDAGNMFYLLGKEQVNEGTYCIAGDDTKILREYIEEIRKCFGEGALCEYKTDSLDDNAIELDVDISRFISETGYKPQVPFDEGIRRIVRTLANV